MDLLNMLFAGAVCLATLLFFFQNLDFTRNLVLKEDKKSEIKRYAINIGGLIGLFVSFWGGLQVAFSTVTKSPDHASELGGFFAFFAAFIVAGTITDTRNRIVLARLTEQRLQNEVDSLKQKMASEASAFQLA